MNNEGKFWTSIVALVVVVIVSVASIAAYYNYQDDHLYVTRGYEQVMLPGSPTFKWQKVKKCGK